MHRVERIIKHPVYREGLIRNADREKERIFCRHDFQHMLDVARITYILLMEAGEMDRLMRAHALDGSEAVREAVYAAGLLHDISRWRQYDTGVDHAAAGARDARPILLETGFKAGETDVIARAIAAHRHGGPEGGLLGRLLARADDLARPCASCPARRECYKAEDMPAVRQALVY
ncbi:HD domain-containing protein [Desulfotomaculum copahuensis]|uniref:Phosphohydrolase n=1 Tax=Desulfotomaculum copahuensis TaxID=1838280 RepID=A0A1B7LCQ4_9FIRM|nr:HD domain-containing protein [Desulfotomaculum copahuensis]OAT80707.1 phosphohydrolase [Desulfotomaculum copahuensis]